MCVCMSLYWAKCIGLVEPTRETMAAHILQAASLQCSLILSLILARTRSHTHSFARISLNAYRKTRIYEQVFIDFFLSLCIMFR